MLRDFIFNKQKLNKKQVNKTNKNTSKKRFISPVEIKSLSESLTVTVPSLIPRICPVSHSVIDTERESETEIKDLGKNRDTDRCNTHRV